MSFIKHGLPTAFDFCFIFYKMGAVFKLLQRYELLCHVGLSIQSFYSYFPVTPGIHVSTIGKWPSIQSLILQPPEDFPVEGLLPPLCVTLYWAAMVTYAQCRMHYDTECRWELIPPVEGHPVFSQPRMLQAWVCTDVLLLLSCSCPHKQSICLMI